jgi:phosphoenolpyruvate carboxylase
VAVTLFHGRGGSIGARRRADLAGASVAAARVDRRHAARDRAGGDDPGEVRPAGIALRTLEVYTTATLEARSRRVPVRPEWRAAMDRLAVSAARAYRGVVYEDERFSATSAP